MSGLNQSFLLGGFLYLTVGSLYKSQVLNYAGVEALPHIEFWRSVPSLVAVYKSQQYLMDFRTDGAS
jgi:hypothetical protein